MQLAASHCTATCVTAHSAQAFLLSNERVRIKTRKVAVLVGRRKKKEFVCWRRSVSQQLSSDTGLLLPRRHDEVARQENLAARTGWGTEATFVLLWGKTSQSWVSIWKKKWRPSSLGENLNICLLFFFYFKRMLIYTPGARLCDWYCWNWWLFCTYELCESFCRTQRISKSVWNETFFFFVFYDSDGKRTAQPSVTECTNTE